jgi:ubiquinone/menaquinone biosynthesis C-methylase UbiE
MVDVRDAITQRLLVDAGIAAGMRVLDVGCGSGDVSFMLAQMVGEGGQVVGVDRDPRPLAVARDRAQALGFPNVRFVEGNFDALSAEPDKFDAAVGRRVLMYQPEPIDALGQLVPALRPGGLVIFQEHDSATVLGVHDASLPLHERVRGWIWETVKREGAYIHMGLGLATALARAGFAIEGLRAEAIVHTPTMHYPAAAIVRAMLPRIVRRGVATEQEIDIETLDQRMVDERVKAETTSVWELVFGAWARKPDQTTSS